MNTGLQRLLADYRQAVAEAVRLLEAAGVPRPTSNMEWVAMFPHFSQTGWLSDGRRYMMHGYGCLVEGSQSRVNFDFGDNGEIDGIDPGFLTQFVEGRLAEYEFESEADVLAAFERAFADGELTKSGSLYYLRGGGLERS